MDQSSDSATKRLNRESVDVETPSLPAIFLLSVAVLVIWLWEEVKNLA